jgi:predicted metal-binding membrane protein
VIDRTSQRRAFYASGLALAALAWALLWFWAASPWGRYLEHGDWTRLGLAGAICAALPAGERLLPATLYAGGWVLMLAAMMLPTTLPVLATFERMIARRPDRRRLMALAIAGYLAAWAGFGLAAHVADLGLAALVRQSAWAAFNGWVVGAAVIVTAGLFQFSAVKRACLAQCRRPLGQVLAHWHGIAPGREAFGLGLGHGIFCVGCCWALMLLMFVVGSGNVGWMLALALAMAAEKNLPRGHRLSAPLGVGLLLWGAGIVAAHA